MSAPGLSYGLSILDFIRENETCGFNAIRDALQLSPSSLSRYLTALANAGYILKYQDSKYVLGPKFNILQRDREQSELYRLLYPFLERVGRTTHSTVLWIRYTHGKMICLEKFISPLSLHMQNVGETRTDYFHHPWGYLFLATCTPAQRTFWKSHSQSGQDMPIPENDLQERFYSFIATHGYADDFATIYPNLRRLAFPCYDRQHELTGALAIGTLVPQTDQGSPGHADWIRSELGQFHSLWTTA